ncbi:MAG: serine protease [Nostocaceae cyanobacterium]|nr:serine protease [Nostocaceae cyanobacterium]
MKLPMYERLKQCTVRLKVAGELGTGFFVAPGLILTCAHVVKEVIGKTDKPIDVWWQNQDYTAVIEKLPENPDVDLALLRLTKSPANHPCVSLDVTASVGNKLYTFGYTNDYIHGEPATFDKCDGFDGANLPFTLLKFSQGQVRPGFSGSPLLNTNTGKVCGVVKRTRDRSSDLGGRAVPTSVIFAVFPELSTQQPTPDIRNNPFVPQTGKVTDAKDFFDRQREIRAVFEILNSGSSVALIGERSIGKSSLLCAIQQQAESQLMPPRKPIYLDMTQLYNENDFYDFLCSEVGIEECKGFRLTRALEKQRPRLLLLLDEFEKMTWQGFTKNLRGQLRGLADGNDAPLRLVVAASTSLDRLFPDSHEFGMVSPFQNICLEEEITLWDEATVRDFISSRLAPTPVQFTDEEVMQIAIASRGHPQELMQLCNRTYKRYKEEMG